MEQVQTDKVRVINTATGQIQMVRRSIANHAIFGARLVEVEDTVKPYTPALYQETTPEEFKERHPQKVKSAESEETQEETMDEVKEENGIS